MMYGSGSSYERISDSGKPIGSYGGSQSGLQNRYALKSDSPMDMYRGRMEKESIDFRAYEPKGSNPLYEPKMNKIAGAYMQTPVCGKFPPVNNLLL
jgi:hypothetical protein